MKRPIVIIGILFFVFGLVTWLGSVLVPYLRIACQLSNVASYLVAFAFYISYAVMAIPSAAILRRTGYRKGMALGLLVMAAGALLFIPAAMSRWYLLFLVGQFVQGTGLAILQTAANPYVTILGPMEGAARRMSIMGICNGIAGILGPAVLGSVILENADDIQRHVAGMAAAARGPLLDMLAHRAIIPYCNITAALLGLCVWVYFSGLPEPGAEEEDDEDAGLGGVVRFPHLMLGVLTLFLYVGVEVIAGDTIINYGASQGIALSTARFFASFTLTCMLVGYLLGIVVTPTYLSQRTILKVSAGMGVLFALGALSTHGVVSVTCIGLLGLANAMVWPSIWPLALDGLGRYTRIGSSLLILAIGGGAVMPLLYGWLADGVGAQHAYWLVVPIYLFIGGYAFFRRR